MLATLKKSSDYDLTVIIVTYNHKERIKRCLDSVLNQRTIYRYKVIIADDFSTDGASEICAEYADRFSNVIHLLRSENVGVVKNLYPILCCVDTEFWCVLDGDDYWSDDSKIQICIDALKQHPECVAVAHQTRVLLDYGDAFVLTSKQLQEIHKNYGKIHLSKKELFPLPHTSSRIYRNIIDYGSLLPKSIWDIFTYLIYLSRGDILYIDRVMSVYDRSVHPSIYNSLILGTLFQKKQLLKKDRLIFAQISKFLNWEYDDVLCKSMNLSTSKNKMRNWINFIKKDDTKTKRYKVLKKLCEFFNCQINQGITKTLTFKKRAHFFNGIAVFLGLAKPFKIKKRISA